MLQVAILVLLTLATQTAEAPAEDDTATLEELFYNQYGAGIHEIAYYAWAAASLQTELPHRSNIDPFSGESSFLPLAKDIITYVKTIQFTIISEFSSDLGNMTLESIYLDINIHCAQYLEVLIEDLTEPNNVTCVTRRLWKMLAVKMKKDIVLGLHELSRHCIHQQLPLCVGFRSHCILAYGERVGKLLGEYIEDASGVVQVVESAPLAAIQQCVVNNAVWLAIAFDGASNFLFLMALYISSVPPVDPFSLENLIYPRTKEDVVAAFFKNDTSTQSQEQLTWGIVRSSSGSVHHLCTHFRDIYPRDSKEYSDLLYICFRVNMYLSCFDLTRCAYKDPTSTPPLAWSTVSPLYFDSQCLCLAYSGTECGVKAPRGVDARLYCLSTLLRDFQRQVSYRPAVTYLDYSFKSRFPICRFANLLVVGFKSACAESEAQKNFPFVLSVQCHFKGLVNKQLNCTETPQVDTYNVSVLCALQTFMEFVLCDDGVDVSVGYYGPGDSPLVQVLTYVDISVRVLTLTTYLACPQLRNLPGKLLMGYQVTALLRLVVVRASLEDLALAVRLDVTFDLASTLWLTAYLHFLTMSIRTLRLPDSLTTYEALIVLLRYALFGWALPAALSTAFFWMDEALDSSLMVGQLLFVLCNYLALFGNLYMFFHNAHFYYDVKKSAFDLKRGVRTRSVFADLFNFVLKTSVLSGAGITFRLIFSQIQGLEHLLSYYHALGTLQALLFFVLYGCNRQARDFWRGALSRTLHLCFRSKNNST